jgi:hypothetical protein
MRIDPDGYVSVTKSIKLGDDTRTAAAAEAGTIRWDGASVQYSNGSDWNNINEAPPSNFTYATREDALADSLYAYWDTGDKTLTVKGVNNASLNYFNGSLSGAGAVASSGGSWDRGSSSAGGFELKGMLTGGDITFTFWINVTDTTIHNANDGAGVFWPSGAGADAGTLLWAYNAQTGPLSFRAGGSVGGFTGNSTLVQGVTVNTWYHFGITKTGNNYKYYVNGVLVLTETHAGIVWGDSWWLSNYSQHGGNTNNHYHRGKIDEITVWSRTLSDEEIGNLYDVYINGYSLIEDNTGDRFYNNVKLYLRGSELTDLSPVGRTITDHDSAVDTTMGAPFSGAPTSNRIVGHSTGTRWIEVAGPLEDLDPSEGDLTIEFWLARTQNSGSYGHFYNIGGLGTGQNGQGVIKFHSGTSYGLYWYGGGMIADWNNGYLVLDQWDHYVFERSGNITTVWMNGVQKNQYSNVNFPAGVWSGGYLGIGLSGNGSEYGHHVFAELRVTNAARYGGATTIPVQSSLWETS